MSSSASEWQQDKGQGGAAVEASLPSSARSGANTTCASLDGARMAAQPAFAPTWGASVAREGGLAAFRIWQMLSTAGLRLWGRVEVRRATQRRRSLRVLETVAMGDKRFVAIVQVKEARFLIGGGSAGVSLLARLDAEQEFAAVLDEQAATPPASIPQRAVIAVPPLNAVRRSNEVAG